MEMEFEAAGRGKRHFALISRIGAGCSRLEGDSGLPSGQAGMGVWRLIRGRSALRQALVVIAFFVFDCRFNMGP